jgi:transketolase
VPDDVRAYFAERAKAKRAAREEADARLARWRAADPERAAAWDALREKRLPEGFAASWRRRSTARRPPPASTRAR